MKNNILITGCAGFIGYHIAKKFCDEGYSVIGIDNINDYYDINLKNNRLNILNSSNNFSFYKMDITDDNIGEIFKKNKITYIFHLAAQAGVRYSLENPFLYIKSNITGFLNILECCKKYSVKFLFYASSSSVYGDSSQNLKEENLSNSPKSLYGATKISNELLASTYYSLYGINSIGLRFFTVYGPWGRPDMAYFSFTNAILNNEEIKIYNMGEHKRAFTYIDDIVHSILLLFKIFRDKSDFCDILNIGGSNSIRLMDFVNTLEDILNKHAIIKKIPKQLGDVESTSSDCSKLYNLINFSPNVNLKLGLTNFAQWYKQYYKI